MNKADTIAKITEIVERAGREQGIEPVEVDLVGGGEHRVLRIFIDKIPTDNPPVAADTAADPEAHPETDAPQLPPGVTHEDCQFISEYVGTVLDVEDLIPGGRYTLEVSSPGVERKLTKPRDFERHVGQAVKVVCREPIAGRSVWEGTLQAFAAGRLTVAPAQKKGKNPPPPDPPVEIPLDSITRANLKFEW